MIRIFSLLIFIVSCGKPISEERNFSERNPLVSGVSEEMILNTKMILNFNLLPLQGEVKKDGKFWSGDSWRLVTGSINNRWNTKTKIGFDYKSPAPWEIYTLPVEVMKSLSPSEKYDIYMGRYDYPLKREVDYLARSGREKWEGLCHGWAGASINHIEPASVVLKNPEGVEVHFGSSDVKALLTYAYSKLNIKDQESIGRRCEESYLMGENCDNDLTPLAFHAVLANKIGIDGQSFIADMERYKEVWNHPVVGYHSKILRSSPFLEGKIIQVETRVSYMEVIEKNEWEKNTLKNIVSYMTVKYDIELDRYGNMIGSKWISKDRPDFLWTISSPYQFRGYLSSVEKLLK